MVTKVPRSCLGAGRNQQGLPVGAKAELASAKAKGPFDELKTRVCVCWGVGRVLLRASETIW